MTTTLFFFALAACGGAGPADTSATDTSPHDTAASESGGVTAEECTGDEVFLRNVCTGCGPTDGCTGMEDLCLATCTPEQQWQGCADGGTCMDGVCYPAICG